jgi:hypothetical protein
MATGIWINSISISTGYKATCYITNNYIGTNIILTSNIQDLSTIAFSNKINSIIVALI